MRKRKNWPEIILSESHRYKIGLDLICEFLHQRPDDAFETMWKANWSVKDYGLEQFQWWISRRLEDTERFNRDKL